MPGGILDNNDYVEEQALQRGGRGGRGGQGPGPGGGFGGAFGFGGGGYGFQPGGYGTNPLTRKVPMQGARGPVPVTMAQPGFQAGKTGPGALNQAQGASGGFRGMTEGLARGIGRRNGVGTGGAGGYSPAGELGEFQNAGDPRSLANWLLSQYQAGGNFDPNGNPAIMRSLQDNAARQGNQASQRAQLNADVSGMDPAQAAAYRARTDVASNTASQQGISEAMLQQLLSRQQFGDNLFGGMLDHSYGWDRADQQGQLERRMASQQRGGGLGGFLGNIGGAVLGGFNPFGGGRGQSQPAGGGASNSTFGRSTFTTPQRY